MTNHTPNQSKLNAGFKIDKPHWGIVQEGDQAGLDGDVGNHGWEGVGHQSLGYD
jgi:hypothetical protein